MKIVTEVSVVSELVSLLGKHERTLSVAIMPEITMAWSMNSLLLRHWSDSSGGEGNRLQQSSILSLSWHLAHEGFDFCALVLSNFFTAVFVNVFPFEMLEKEFLNSVTVNWKSAPFHCAFVFFPHTTPRNHINKVFTSHKKASWKGEKEQLQCCLLLNSKS